MLPQPLKGTGHPCALTEKVLATLGGGESAAAESPYYSFTNDYSFSWAIPCGPGCVINVLHDFLPTRPSQRI